MEKGNFWAQKLRLCSRDHLCLKIFNLNGSQVEMNQEEEGVEGGGWPDSAVTSPVPAPFRREAY